MTPTRESRALTLQSLGNVANNIRAYGADLRAQQEQEEYRQWQEEQIRQQQGFQQGLIEQDWARRDAMQAQADADELAGYQTTAQQLFPKTDFTGWTLDAFRQMAPMAPGLLEQRNMNRQDTELDTQWQTLIDRGLINPDYSGLTREEAGLYGGMPEDVRAQDDLTRLKEQHDRYLTIGQMAWDYTQAGMGNTFAESMGVAPEQVQNWSTAYENFMQAVQPVQVGGGGGGGGGTSTGTTPVEGATEGDWVYGYLSPQVGNGWRNKATGEELTGDEYFQRFGGGATLDETTQADLSKMVGNMINYGYGSQEMYAEIDAALAQGDISQAEHDYLASLIETTSGTPR